MGLNPLEIAVGGLLVLLLFGTKRLPELGSGLGKAITNFKNAYRDGTSIDVTPSATTQTPSDKIPVEPSVAEKK